MVGVEILQTNQPYYLPGYIGYCPQNRFVCGDTYAHASHNLLLDPTVSHAEKLALVDNTKEYEVVKPSKNDIKMVNSRLDKKPNPVYKHEMMSSYDGFIPNRAVLRDKSIPVVATQGIANFERQQLKQKASRECFKRILAMQSGCPPKNSKEQSLIKSKYRLPLTELRPQRIGIERNYFVDEKYLPEDCDVSPYFMENTNPKKFFISGYTGYVPFNHVHFGKPFKKMSGDGLRDFTSNYLNKKRLEWAPLTIPCKKQDMSSMPRQIYQIHLKDTPLMPSYTGHVPGANDEVGKTYGSASKKANQYLKDLLFSLNSKKCYDKIKK